MDRLFLDANVLFSAAYRPNAGLLSLWKLNAAALCSSRYALEEARFNLTEESQRQRLARLSTSLELFDAAPEETAPPVHLPAKDLPILQSAIAAGATHLLTGDVRHFGQFFGKRIEGVLVLLPGEYLKQFSGGR